MILDWAPRHDPRSLDYPIREAVGRVERRDKQWATGPVVIGIPWYDGMYQAPGGVLRRAGTKVGGHALLATGYTQQSEKTGGSSITLQNSWGNDWGNNGLAEIAVPDLAALLAEQGEACVPTSRSYGR